MSHRIRVDLSKQCDSALGRFGENLADQCLAERVVMAGHGQDLRQKPRYQLDPDEFESLTLQLVRRFRSQFQKAAEDGHSSICIALEGTDPLSDICRDIERRAFATLADNLPAHTMAEEYGPYEQQSLFLLGLDTAEGLPRATLRLIIGIAGIGPPTKSVRDAVLPDGDREERERPIDLRDTEVKAAGLGNLRAAKSARSVWHNPL